MLTNYKELNVWKKAYNLGIEVYKITRTFPIEELYGLTSQIRRAAVSTPSNIAEGYGRKTTPEYLRSLYIAYGSYCELETQTLLAGDLNLTKTATLNKLLSELGEVDRMLNALMIKAVKYKHNSCFFSAFVLKFLAE
jgi:four helix bundle protein